MPRSTRRLSPPVHPAFATRLALGVAALMVAGFLLWARPVPAGAAVVHQHGFRATVDGFSSWYGSYGMASLGTAWCIDHGSRAPDPAFRYVPADLSAVGADIQAAVAWVVARHGQGADPVAHAAVMLAVHDLMGARYPSGRLDVDQLTTARMAGFDSRALDVLTAARWLKADGLAHRHLRPPLRLTLQAGRGDPAGQAEVTAQLVDGAGHALAGLPVRVALAGRTATLTTGADGRATTRLPAPGIATQVTASTTVPHLPLDAWAPTTTSAQRVARPTSDVLTAAATVAAATGQVVVVKRGDAEAWLPVAGARFRVETLDGRSVAGRVTVGPNGRAEPLTVPAGTYRVVEEAAPPGYDVAGPWTVSVEPGRTATADVVDPARRSTLRLRKVDSESGAPLSGATFVLRYDADADGTFEVPVAEVVTTGVPTRLEGLLPGRYELRETVAPSGYRLDEKPLVVELPPGEEREVLVPNDSVPPLSTTTTAAPTTTAPAPTTAPPTSAPATTAPPPTTVGPSPTTAPPPATVLSTVPTVPASLPRTGVDLVTAVLLGLGLVLVGRSLLDLAR